MYSEILQREATAHLDFLRAGLAEHTYPGYPRPAERFVSDPNELLHDDAGRLVLPDGTWSVDWHTSRPDTEKIPTAERQQELEAAGYILDSKGRPLHPWLLSMIADPLIGVVTGKGCFWEWGANQTIDSVVIKRNHVLMIERNDTGEHALPGGFLNANELAIDALRRETAEETGLVIPETALITELFHGPVADIRTTAHAWPETTAFLVQLDDEGAFPEVLGADDARSAMWVPLERVVDLHVFGGHPYVIAQAQRILMQPTEAKPR